MSNIFKIDYDTHKSYKHVKPRLKDFIYNNVKFIFSFVISLIWLIFLSRTSKKIKKGKFNSTNKFFKHGVVSLENNHLVSKLRQILSEEIKVIDKKINDMPINDRGIDNTINSYKKTDHPEIYSHVEKNILDMPEIKEILSNFFNSKIPKLVHLNIHLNQEDDIYVFKHDKHDVFDDEMNFFHVDTNLNTIKLMVYLTDVTSEENGAFEYVLESNELFTFKNFLIRRVIRKIGAYKRDLKAKKMLLSLPNFIRIKNDLSDFSKNSKLGIHIKNNKKTFLSNNNIIIFDPLGIHRGGRVKRGKRIAIQLVFCSDNFSWQIR